MTAMVLALLLATGDPQKVDWKIDEGLAKLLIAQPALCTDNAAMIGYVAALKLAHGEASALSTDIDPNLRLIG